MKYKNQSLFEVEQMIKNDQLSNDMQVSVMAQLSGIRGRQFGKEVFATVVPFKDLMKFLTVFKDVQREINERKIASIKAYTLSGVELIQKAENAMRFFPGITATARGFIYYDENSQKIAIDPNNSKFSVNDGQHRLFSIAAALDEIEDRYKKAKKGDTKNYYREQLEVLGNMVIPITIFSDMSEDEERQLFHDTNRLASRPSRSATIRLSQTDIVAKMARELADENKFFAHYGVEREKMSIHPKNPNTILLTTIYAGLKELYRDDLIHNRNRITSHSYSFYKKTANETFNKIFTALPADIEKKDKYITEKSYTLRAICKFVHHCRVDLTLKEELIYKTIEQVDWNLSLNYWKKYNGSTTPQGSLVFGGNSNNAGFVAVYTALCDTLDAVKVNSLRVGKRENKQEEARKKARA